MYQCRKCGKQLTYEAEYCSKCLEEINASKKASSSGEIKPKKQKGRVMDGFGPALTGTILGGIGFSLILISFFVVAAAVSAVIAPNDQIKLLQFMNPEVNYITRDVYQNLQVGAWLSWVFGLILIIPSLILGIKSIMCFVNAKRKNRKKPIPALIIGIETVVGVAFALIYAVIAYSALAVL